MEGQNNRSKEFFSRALLLLGGKKSISEWYDACREAWKAKGNSDDVPSLGSFTDFVLATEEKGLIVRIIEKGAPPRWSLAKAGAHKYMRLVYLTLGKLSDVAGLLQADREHQNGQAAK